MSIRVQDKLYNYKNKHYKKILNLTELTKSQKIVYMEQIFQNKYNISLIIKSSPIYWIVTDQYNLIVDPDRKQIYAATDQ